MALLAVGLFVGCSRGRAGETPEGAGPTEMSAPATTPGTGPPPTGSTTVPSGPISSAPAGSGPSGDAGPAGGAGTSSASSGASFGGSSGGSSGGPSDGDAAPVGTPAPTAGGTARPVACAGVAFLDAALPSTVEQVAALLGEVRTLAADTVDPRAADARLLGLVPQARRLGADLARDGRVLSGLVPDLEAGLDPDLGADLARAAAAAAGAEVLLGERLAAVDRIDDLVVAAQAPAADPVAASAQRAKVLDWAAVGCASPDPG